MNTKNILTQFDKAMDAVEEFNEESAYDILLGIANALNDSENDDMIDFGDYLYNNVTDDYVSDDWLEDCVIPYRLKQSGAAGVACLLAQYDNHYYIHSVTEYGNINDNNLFSNLKETIEDYKEQFTDLIK